MIDGARRRFNSGRRGDNVTAMPVRPRASAPIPWRTIVAYAALLAGGTALLDWIDYHRLVRSGPAELYTALLATVFLALGVVLGVRLVRRRPEPPASQADAQSALGVTPRELEVLHAIAEGLSTKEIARRLAISPNTVKTHAARLFEKLSAVRRTDAIARARTLGLLR